MKNFKGVIIIGLFAILQSCKKQGTTNTVTGGDTGTDTGSGTIVAGTDAAVAATQGFFLDGWATRTFAVPGTQDAAKPSTSGVVNVTVDLSQITTKVSKLIFGNNTNPYMGQYVTDPTLMANITALAPNILRAPGGSISDIYFWNGDGAVINAPADAPAKLLDGSGNASDAGYWYGNNTQSWTFTIDNYYKVLQQTSSTGLIIVNYGYARYGTGPHPDQAAAHLAANWVRYDKGKTQFWDVGNENYGSWEAGYRIDVSQNKDGQPEFITGKVYGAHFKVFADSMRKAAAEVGNANIKIGAVLTSTDDVNNNAGVKNWNADVLATAGNSPDYFVVHNYYTPYNDNSSASVILNTAATSTSQLMAWVKSSVSKAGVMQKPVALDEWNIQATGSAQNVSNIAGLHAVMSLGEMLKNQFSMASRWDLANGWAGGDDMGMFNIGDETGVAKWNPRPAFYYMYYFQKYFGDRMVNSIVINSSDISSYASTFSSGQAGVVLVNQSDGDHVVTVKIKNFAAGDKYYYYTLKGGGDNAPFSHQVLINGIGPANGKSGGSDSYASIPANTASISGGITVTVPKYGAVFLVADKK
ncbi:alpha-L-arabinofuranosidase [Mucilaginibacter sp.]|uniref:alpha-L-arabinofuranosidase n=1 Tax=Mucilaginibacter sp. TaxID=1882438 RepID=UPI0025F43B28|nr:alpha-L-arabinofuranosidase [Mucilaginibacter sp.]